MHTSLYMNLQSSKNVYFRVNYKHKNGDVNNYEEFAYFQ